MRWWDYSQFRFHLNGRVCLLNSTLFGLACVFLCHAANPPIVSWLTGLFDAGVGVPLALILLAVYLSDTVLSVRSAIQIGSRLASLHAVHDELAQKLESLKAEAAQTVHARLEPISERADDLAARLESARAEAQQKLRALYDRQGFFERRLLHSFPSLRSVRHADALKKLKENLRTRRK